MIQLVLLIIVARSGAISEPLPPMWPADCARIAAFELAQQQDEADAPWYVERAECVVRDGT